ncbi:hypothetical protein GCM10011402_33560 [Paracoccus acridae]|uniref:Uncharacterized protein n=1 Tax=Paracoccus acridae TaxID=1795310 RepID=A0ABQ1VM14_9RHOB|nr:hypothetical protein GCM10011402_33560 [Paracoccus acridae]
MISGSVVPGARFSDSRSAIIATLTSLTPGSRSTARVTFVVQAAQSMPVTVHSRRSAVSAAIFGSRS